MKDKPAILVVDDEEMMRTVITELLEDFGCIIEALHRAEPALEWFEANHDRTVLVILDLALPGVPGVEAFRRFRQVDDSVPVVLISGSDMSQEGDELLSEGAYGVLQKPFRADKIEAVVESALTKEL